ncbi:MAG: zinc ribbon domain-containing protein, partial [Phycisphaerales bacterium]|nr:zinc ribbon domain-containing protein [Phycisphaerales bacterium]
MSDPTPQPPQPPPHPEPDAEHIGLDLPEALRARPQPVPSIDRPSLVPDSTDLDACPNCGKPMAADAVVCFNCGYDQKSSRVVKPEVGVVVLEPEAPLRR